MLRPATPLTILFFVAFVLLLLATISTPIVTAIPLAAVNGISFGVFGYCQSSGCSKPQVGYPVDGKSTNDNSNFSLPSSARSSLSSILVVHPVAALLTLICFILSATAHLHSPSHSPRYLLALLILSIPTFLITLLAFLVDILLFVPHLAWGGWIVLASTILILASGIVTCAMRRTLVSRKARKKRIAENAEMNGENFYARQNQEQIGIRAESPPPLASGAIGESGSGSGSDKLPTFATFETKSSGEDDRTPLNTRTPSNKTLPSMLSSRGGYSDDGPNRYAGPGRGGPGNMRGVLTGIRGGRGGFGGPPRDEYSNPLPSSNTFGPLPPGAIRRDRSEPPRTRYQYSDEAMNGPQFPARGRGGYPPRGFGRGGLNGPGRGGYGKGMPIGAMAAGSGAGIMAGEMRSRGQGSTVPGYGNAYPPMGRPGQYDTPSGPAGYGRSPSAPGYGRRPSPGPPSAPGGYGRRPSPGPPSVPGGYNRGPSPGPPSMPGGYDAYAQREPSPGPAVPCRNPSPPLPLPTTHPDGGPIIGQAVEMDAVTGSPSMSPSFARPMQPRDNDSDVQGFVGLQQRPKHRDSPKSMTSNYSSQEPYVPPRAAWTGTSVLVHGMTPPNAHTEDPVELPTQNTLRKPFPQSTPHARNASSDNYYEDVDPRFAEPPQGLGSHLNSQQTQQTQSSNALPSALMPGPYSTANPGHPTIEHNGQVTNSHDSYEELQDGQRSPASDHSNMTSISQRGINPNWRPGYTEHEGRLSVPGSRRLVQEPRDVLLDSNPDFGIGSGRIAAPGMNGGHGQAF